jgi:hypothetical protein
MGKKERLHCSLVKSSLSLKKMECKLLYNMQILTKGNQTRMLFITPFWKCPPFCSSSCVIVLSDLLQVSLKILKNKMPKFFIQDN